MGTGWLDLGELGHPHMGGGDFFRSHDMSQEQASGMTYEELHPAVSTSNGSRMPGWMNQKNAKLAGMGLVAGAAVGMVIVPFLAKKKIISKSKSWHAAAIGAALATPLVASYA